MKKGIDPRDQKKAIAEENARLAKEAELAVEAAARAAAQLEKDTFDALIEDKIPENLVPTTVEQLAAVWFFD